MFNTLDPQIPTSEQASEIQIYLKHCRHPHSKINFDTFSPESLEEREQHLINNISILLSSGNFKSAYYHLFILRDHYQGLYSECITLNTTKQFIYRQALPKEFENYCKKTLKVRDLNTTLQGLQAFYTLYYLFKTKNPSPINLSHIATIQNFLTWFQKKYHITPQSFFDACIRGQYTQIKYQRLCEEFIYPTIKEYFNLGTNKKKDIALFFETASTLCETTIPDLDNVTKIRNEIPSSDDKDIYLVKIQPKTRTVQKEPSTREIPIYKKFPALYGLFRYLKNHQIEPYQEYVLCDNENCFSHFFNFPSKNNTPKKENYSNHTREESIQSLLDLIPELFSMTTEEKNNFSRKLKQNALYNTSVRLEKPLPSHINEKTLGAFFYVTKQLIRFQGKTFFSKKNKEQAFKQIQDLRMAFLHYFNQLACMMGKEHLLKRLVLTEQTPADLKRLFANIFLINDNALHQITPKLSADVNQPQAIASANMGVTQDEIFPKIPVPHPLKSKSPSPLRPWFKQKLFWLGLVLSPLIIPTFFLWRNVFLENRLFYQTQANRDFKVQTNQTFSHIIELMPVTRKIKTPEMPTETVQRRLRKRKDSEATVPFELAHRADFRKQRNHLGSIIVVPRQQEKDAEAPPPRQFNQVANGRASP